MQKRKKEEAEEHLSKSMHSKDFRFATLASQSMHVTGIRFKQACQSFCNAFNLNKRQRNAADWVETQEKASKIFSVYKISRH